MKDSNQTEVYYRRRHTQGYLHQLILWFIRTVPNFSTRQPDSVFAAELLTSRESKALID